VGTVTLAQVFFGIKIFYLVWRTSVFHSTCEYRRCITRSRSCRVVNKVRHVLYSALRRYPHRASSPLRQQTW